MNLSVWHHTVSRWAFGMALVSWRYLWATTPMHRTEETCADGHQPPALPPGVDETGLLSVRDGVGPMFHRRFRAHIVEADQDAQQLMSSVIGDMGRFVPHEVVRMQHRDSAARDLRIGDEFVVDMPGPWNGPVRVLDSDANRLRLGTRPGHLEAGQIEFRARDEDSRVVFEIEAWARPSTRAAHVLYSHLRLAKEIQLNMWVRFCLAVTKASGGRLEHGIDIHTVRAPGRP